MNTIREKHSAAFKAQVAIETIKALYEKIGRLKVEVGFITTFDIKYGWRKTNLG